MKTPLNTKMLTPGQCAMVLKAMGDDTRLRILESLLISEKCVTDLVQKLKCSQPHASHHLRILRDAGLVEGHRDSKQVSYRVSPRSNEHWQTGKDRPWISAAVSCGFLNRR